MSRNLPRRWYVQVRLHLADRPPHFNGWHQRARTFRTRANACAEFDRLAALAATDLAALSIDVEGLRRNYNDRPVIGTTITWGSTGANGKTYGRSEEGASS